MHISAFQPPPARDLGVLNYAQALDLQRTHNQGVIDGNTGPVILLVEHPSVITLTRRKHIRDHLLADDAKLGELGVTTHQTDRGGDITYHGPGQLVAYPIVHLPTYQLNLSRYMRLLEQTVIDTLAQWGIQSERDACATGVWVQAADNTPGLAGAAQPPVAGSCDVTKASQPTLAKIAALGVRIRKHVTMHGLALNIDPDMDHFKLIVPCGLSGRPVVSMRQLLDDACPTMGQVKAALVEALHANLKKSATAPAPETTAAGPTPRP